MPAFNRQDKRRQFQIYLLNLLTPCKEPVILHIKLLVFSKSSLNELCEVDLFVACELLTSDLQEILMSESVRPTNV